MNVKTFTLASAASLLLFLPPAFAQDSTTPATPGAETTAPATSTANEPATSTTATPAKHHRWKHKAKSSSNSEARTTEELNAQQVQNPGTTPSAPTTSATDSSAEKMHHAHMKKHKAAMEKKADDKAKNDMMKDNAPTEPTEPTNPTP